MKPKDPNIIEVVYHEGVGYRKSNMGNPESRFLSKETRASSRNPFFRAFKDYVFCLTVDGFKLRVAGIDDRKVMRADKSRRVCVAGVEPGFYEITEQTEDFIICRKK